MRLIDAAALFKNNCIIIHGEDGGCVAQQVIDIIRNAPTVDAVPVVRCKDCENRECEGRYGLIVCGIDGMSHPESWFCAGGERRNSE